MEGQMEPAIFYTHFIALKNSIDLIHACALCSAGNDKQCFIAFLLGVLGNYIELWKTYNQETSLPEDVEKKVQSLVDSLENVLKCATDDMVLSESSAFQNIGKKLDVMLRSTTLETGNQKKRSKQKMSKTLIDTDVPIQTSEIPNVAPESTALENIGDKMDVKLQSTVLETSSQKKKIKKNKQKIKKALLDTDVPTQTFEIPNIALESTALENIGEKLDVTLQSTVFETSSQKKKRKKNKQKIKKALLDTDVPTQTFEIPNIALESTALENIGEKLDVTLQSTVLETSSQKKKRKKNKQKIKKALLHTDVPSQTFEIPNIALESTALENIGEKLDVTLQSTVLETSSQKKKRKKNKQKIKKALLDTDVPTQTFEIPIKVASESNVKMQRRCIRQKQKWKKRKEQRRGNGIHPTNFDSWINILTRAIDESNKEQSLSISVQCVLEKFAHAMEVYTKYGETRIIDLYERSILCFSEIPYLEDLHCEDFSGLLKSVIKITNTCVNTPKFHILPEDIISKMVLLVQSINKLTKKEDIIKESKSENLLSVITSQPDQEMVQLTIQKLTNYNASLRTTDSTLCTTMNLEFPDIFDFVSFVQDNQVLAERLNLVSKDQDSVPKRILVIKKQLNEQCTSFIRSINSIVKIVNHQLTQSQAQMKSKTVVKKLLIDISDAIKTDFPRHELHIFGSRATGQALPDSDFDLYCDITGRGYLTGLEHSTQKVYVEVLGSKLRQNRKIFSQVYPIGKARVPIIKLIHNPTGMHCDISFKDGTSVENTHLLNVYLELDPRVRWILTAIKLWAHYNQMHGSSSRYFTSHGLSWLVLFYLMNGKLVPPVMDLQVSCKAKIIINNWNVAFQHPKQWVPGTQASALELFRGFFNWVGNADLMTYCLSTFTGDAIPKESFSNIEWLKNYKGGAYREYAERLEMERPTSKGPLSSYDKIEMNGLCVQDPFEHCKNTTTLVKDILLENFLWASRETSCVLNRMDLKLVNEACVNFEELKLN